MTLAEAEAAYVREVLEGNQWNVLQAAKQAGICRSSLYHLMHKHGIRRPTPSPHYRVGNWQGLTH